MKEIWNSFCAAIVRFFDNRFNGYPTIITPEQDQIAFLKLQLEKERELNKQLIEHFTNAKQEIGMVASNEATNYQPIITGGFTSWSQKQRQLERSARDKAAQLAEEARKRIALEHARNQTTEEIEKELGIAVE